MSPFEALCGYASPPLLSYVSRTSKNEVVDASLRTREQIRSIHKESLSVSQKQIKVYANKRRSKRQFEVGDWVYLRLQPYK